MATLPPGYLDVSNLNMRNSSCSERMSRSEAVTSYLLTVAAILMAAILAIPLFLLLLPIYFVDLVAGRAPTLGSVNRMLTRWG